MTATLRKALWDIRWTAFAFAAGGAGYVFLLSLFYPMVRRQSATFASLIATYPKPVLAALGYSDFTTFAGYLGVEALNVFWPVIVAVFATLAGAAVVAKEIEDGTSEVWLSVPAARWRLLLAKCVALAIGLAACVVGCAVAVAAGALIDGASVSAVGLGAMGVVMTVFLFTVAAYSALLSSMLSTRGLAAGISFAITLAFYVMWLVGGLADSWKALKDFTIFAAYTPQKALQTGGFEAPPILLLLVISAVCVGGALFVFERRDAI